MKSTLQFTAIIIVVLRLTHEQSAAVNAAEQAEEGRVRTLESQIHRLAQSMDRIEAGLGQFAQRQVVRNGYWRSCQRTHYVRQPDRPRHR